MEYGTCTKPVGTEFAWREEGPKNLEVRSVYPSRDPRYTHSRRFSIITDDNLNMIMEDGQANEDVWVIGDASKIEDAPLPATAQVASQKAKYLVKKLNRIVNDVEHKKPFEFHNQGSLAYIGNW